MVEKIERGMKLMKVLAAQNRNEHVDSDKIEEANQIVAELVSDLTPGNSHKIGQIVAYTVEELQKNALDFLNNVADIKTVSYGEKAAFKVKTGGIKAVVQAKGSTTPRSYVADSQILVSTKEISARPAINIIDLRSNRVQIGDLINEANEQITLKKLHMAQDVLQGAISDAKYGSPWYAADTNGLNKQTLDAQIMHFRRFGPVTLLGDIAAVAPIMNLAGVAVNATPTMQYSGNMIDQFNQNGYLGMYNGCQVVCMANAYEEDGITPVLNPRWIYIVPGGQTADARNLKLVNEGGINSIASQNIDDVVYEVRLDCWFGAAFVSGKNPTIGAHYA